MLLDRHRVARLVELAALERTLKGPERLLREDDVTVLVKAAYDDATDEARAAFMARVQEMPTSAWPWSAVQASAPRSGGGGGGGSNALGSLVTAPKQVPPAALILIRGQAESVDADPGNRLPDRGTPEALEWEPLYKALDAWDTQTILRSIGPQGWISILGTSAGDAPRDTAATNGAPARNGSAGTNGTNGTSSNGLAPGGTSNGQNSGGMSNGQNGLPAPQPSPAPAGFSWKHPGVIAAGMTVVVVGCMAVYALSQERKRSRLEEALSRQEELL